MVDNELLSAISNMLDDKLNSIESRLVSIETRLDSIDSRLDSIETKVESIDSNVKGNRKLFLDFYGEQKEHNTEITQKMDELGACVEIFSNQTIKNTADLKRIK